MRSGFQDESKHQYTDTEPLGDGSKCRIYGPLARQSTVTRSHANIPSSHGHAESRLSATETTATDGKVLTAEPRRASTFKHNTRVAGDKVRGAVYHSCVRSAHARSCQTNGAFTLLSLAQARQLPRLLPHLPATPPSVSPRLSLTLSLSTHPSSACRGPADHLFVFRDVTQSDNASLSGTSKLCERIIVRGKAGRASRL